MSEVKRYVNAGLGYATESDAGEYVKYEDYAELKERHDKIAAECVKHNNMAFAFQQRAEAAEAKLAELNDLEVIRSCLSFFTSAIKCKEGWSVFCQRSLDAALNKLAKIEKVNK